MPRLNNAAFVGGFFVILLILSATSPSAAFAATTPSLGAATSYGVLSSTFSNTNPTTINGDVGFTTGSTLPLGSRTNYGSGAPYSQAGTDQGSALSALASQPCTTTVSAGQDLSLLSQPLAPGVYCSTGAISIGTGGITLTGAGTYIFRATGALTTVAGSIVTLASGASACDVFWTPTATTLGANSTFVGTDIDNSGITVGSTVAWLGRALDFATTVTTNTDTITVPSCSSQTSSSGRVTTSGGSSGVSGQFARPQQASTTTVTVTTAQATTTPGFPNTGLPPEGKNIFWEIVAGVGILAVALALVTVFKKTT